MAEEQFSIKKIQEIFKAGQKSDILETLEMIKESGSIIHLPEILKFFKANKDSILHKVIFDLLCDLRDPNAAELIINEIIESRDNFILSELVAITWQTNLDFTSYFELFVSLVIDKPFNIAFDAVTTIDNMVDAIDPNLRMIQADLLKTHLTTTADDKKLLVASLIETLQNPQEKPEW